jgi:hypothetical protein
MLAFDLLVITSLKTIALPIRPSSAPPSLRRPPNPMGMAVLPSKLLFLLCRCLKTISQIAKEENQIGNMLMP